MRSLTLLGCALGVFCSSAQAQTTGSFSVIESKVSDESRGKQDAELSESVRDNILTKIDGSVVQEMERVWRIAGCGVGKEEAVLLLFRMADGSLIARVEAPTNERNEFSFKWHPAAIAIIHTHPNSTAPQPSRDDQKLAEKLRVPIFTLTYRGMFVYDPRTKKVTQIQRGLEWLELSKWK